MKKILLLTVFSIFCLNTSFAQFSIQKGVLEVFTGAWCQYCADGYVKMGQVDSVENAFTVTIHDGDDMATPQCDTMSSYYSPAYPQALINRSGTLLSRANWLSSMSTELQGASSVTVSFDSVFYDQGSRVLDVYLRATFTGSETADLRFGCMIVEDSVSGIGSGYNQINADNNTPGHPYNGAGNPIIGFQHRNILRQYLGGVWGVAGIIPASVSFGDNYTHHFSYTLPVQYNENQISLIGFVSSFGANPNERKILNVEGYASIIQYPLSNNTLEKQDFVSEIYPNPSKGALHFNVSESCILKINDINGRELLQMSLSVGSNSIETDLPPGIYFLSFLNENYRLSKKVVISR